MIRSVRHNGLKRLIEDDDRSKPPAEMIERIRDILTALDDALTIDQGPRQARVGGLTAPTQFARPPMRLDSPISADL